MSRGKRIGRWCWRAPLFRALGRYVFGFDSTLKTYVEDLRRSLASGA